MFIFTGLKKESERLMSESIAKSTKTLYKKFWAQFKSFCERLGLSLREKNLMETLELWVAALSRQGVNYGSILTRLAAVRHQLKKSEKNVKLSSNRLELMLKGIKKKRKPVIGKTPVTLSHVRRMHRASESLERPRALMFKAMTALAFFGFLRPSEMCIGRSKHYLLRGDIQISRNSKYCRVNFRTFKHSDSAQSIRIEELTHGSVRPIEVIKTYLNSTGYSSVINLCLILR